MLRPFAAFAGCSLLAVPLAAQIVPTGFVVETLTTAAVTPNDCCFLPDGRCVIADSVGNVWIYAGTGTAAAAIGTVPDVELGGETGLLSIAADPSFPLNGYVYVYYSSTLDAFMHLDRFTCSGDLANPASTNVVLDPTSRRVILGALPDNVGSRNGGSTRFGPDGKLYQTCGDDANACGAQQPASQVGCLLRLDVSGLGPGGSLVAPAYSALDPGNNPLSANTDFSQLVLGHGLRNPFRMEIDPVTGNLYIGDVGAGAVEEFDEYVVPVGPLPLANFGWPWREGYLPGVGCTGSVPPGLVYPIASVAHGGGWAAVIGGARYRNLGGSAGFGPGYEGDVFFTDYYAGEVRRLTFDGSAWVAAAPVPGQPSATAWATGFDGVTSLRLGPDGALWFTQYPGSLKRVAPVRSVQAISGGGQRGPSGEAFPQPLVVRVLDPTGAPLPGGLVDFAVSGNGALSTSNPVVADPNGYAQTTVTATGGGTITVTATTPGGVVPATFGLFSRKITALTAGTFLILTITGQTDAVPALIPYVVMLSFPGSPVLPTVVGPLCIDPGYALALVIEDGIGVFNFVSFSGNGGVGNPGMTRLYTPPAGIFAGQLMHFQAVGFDAITGWFRTNCEARQF